MCSMLDVLGEQAGDLMGFLLAVAHGGLRHVGAKGKQDRVLRCLNVDGRQCPPVAGRAFSPAWTRKKHAGLSTSIGAELG